MAASISRCRQAGQCGRRREGVCWLVTLSTIASLWACFIFSRVQFEYHHTRPSALPLTNNSNSSSDGRDNGSSSPGTFYIFYVLDATGRDSTVTVATKEGHHRTCTFTGNQSMYNRSVAAVFHDDTPLNHFPKYRQPHQKWVMRTMETPVNTVLSVVKRIRLRQSRHLFNITSTYSSHSDVPTPYYDSVCSYAVNSTMVPSGEPDHVTSIVAGKKRPIAWFVTHCWTSSQRERYVSELQRYIDVDVYGKCGKYRCALGGSVDCLAMLENRYYFYLAFENSLCVDYVTEKFWRLVGRDVIAIVLGAANYSSFMPPDTYLDVRDFPSPRHLADRLRRLLADDGRLYAEMLARKRRVRCVTSVDGGLGFAQKLCRYLDETLARRQVRDLDDVWNAKKMCADSGSFYRGVADSLLNKTMTHDIYT